MEKSKIEEILINDLIAVANYRKLLYILSTIKRPGMNTVGKFKITDTFKSKDQKGIIVGNILDGSIAIGNYLCLTTEMGEVMLKILGMEKITTISGLRFTGLLFEFNDKFEAGELKSLREKEIEIIEQA